MFDIVVAHMNRNDQLPSCIKSIRNSFLKGCRLIIVDYGSVNPTRIDDMLNNTVLVRSEADRWNESIAKNIGVAFTETEYIIIMNADIIIPPIQDMPSEMIAAMNSNTHLYWLRFDLTQQASHEVSSKVMSGENYDYEHYYKDRYGRGRTTGATGDFLFARKNHIIELGGYDERMFGYGYMDTDLCQRLSKIGLVEKWIEKPLLLHKHHPQQPNIREDTRTNREIRNASVSEMLRNLGPQTFDKYKGLPSWVK